MLISKTIDQNHETLKKEFFLFFLDNLNSLRDAKKIVIWLSWWNSLNIFYDELKNNFWKLNKTIREKIIFCFLDERIVQFTSDDSNYKNLKDTFLWELLEKWYILEEQILLPDFSLEDYADDYFKKVKKIDIALFWVWEDWHIASLFPKHELLWDESLSYLTIHDSPKPPDNRITISKSMFYQIRHSFVFFMWESKKQAMLDFLDYEVDYINCPAKLVLECEDTFLISDNNIN
jgi:6-phosphogluconolactonase/glucosamine-6-phosphate isomerase/deaminase